MQTTSRSKNLLMRACPRCGGDLYRDLLEIDEEFVCLQCGRRAAKGQIAVLPPQEAAREWRSVA